MSHASAHSPQNPLGSLAPWIIPLRNQSVLLDSVVAELYGVPTKRVNEAVARNRGKFPRGYVFTLTAKEWGQLKSQPATSIRGASSAKRGEKVKAPKAFTEKGLYMLATVLKSKSATQATLEIVETFAQLRQFSQVAKALAEAEEPSEQKRLIGESSALMGQVLNRAFSFGDGEGASSETSVELNLALLKIKHTVKRESSE